MTSNETKPFFSLEIPWEIVLIFALLALVLIYFLFFQQYLTALIWRAFLSIFVPKNLQINFKRVIFSFVSGHITMFDVTIITEDMSIHIDKIAGKLFYWRQILNISSEVEKTKSRFNIHLFGLDITIYNRAWSTDLVENVKKLFEEGKTTEYVTNYIKSLYPEPAPHQLSVLLRMILPMKIRIYAFSLKIGNPRMPAFLLFKCNSISGYYTLIPKISPHHSVQSYLDLDILKISMKSIPLTINDTPFFKDSMRNIYTRSHRQYEIMNAKNLELHVLTDLYGLYVLSEDEVTQTTQQPQMIIDATFRKSSSFRYGPYIDKLRRFFMEFYAPFVYNDTVLYDNSRKRIKYWVVNVNFPDGSKVEMPFVTDTDDPKDPNREKREGSLIISFGKDSKCQMHIPQYIGDLDENKFEMSSLFSNIQISTSIADPESRDAGPPIIEASLMNLNVGYFYPENWNRTTTMSVFANFQNSQIYLAPYHIDYLSQFGTDFVSWYPFLTEPETIFNFFPYEYYIKVVFEDSTFHLFTEPTPDYESFYKYKDSPQAKIKTQRLSFGLALQTLKFEEAQKSVNFMVDIEKGEIQFFLPDTHLMRVRRGPENVYDNLSMEKFSLSGSYRWSADPHDDCQIPVTMRISQVEGLITIGTLVSLIGTIANYTSRERLHPKAWKDPPPKTIFDYINNTNAVVSIDYGKVKVPLDLYEPSAGAIAHASGILIGVEGYHPFWHVMVDIGCAVVELPRTEFPYDRYFNETLQSENGPKGGIFHVEYIHITMKTISTFTGYDYIETHTKIGCEIGNIDGFCVMPQLFCGLEIAWNIIHSFFSDDTFPIKPYDPFYIYKVEVFRICIGSIRVYLDMGSIGLVCAMLPGGVVVYSDTLIDENAHYVIFVHLPSIDAHILQSDQNDERVISIFRASTYLNVVRDIKFDDGKNDAIRQIQLLRMYDVLLKPERFVNGTKRNYYTYLFDFINQDKSQLSSDYFYIPEMMRPETYHSSLDEDYELAYIYVSDPRNNNAYSLMIPELRYPSYEKFINMEDGIQWLHHYETVRFYTHLSPTNRNLINIPSIDPKVFATQFYEKDKIRARNSNGAIRLVLPNTVLVQLVPTALINAKALLNAFNLFPNEQLMAKVVRSTVGDEFDVNNYHSSTINVILPQVKVLIHDPNFGIALSVNNVNIRFVNTLDRTKIDENTGKEKHTTNLTLYINAVSLECTKNDNNGKPSIFALVPDICLVNVNDKGAVKINPIKLFFGYDSPFVLKSIIQTLPKYLEGLSPPTIGDRCDELIRYIEANPKFKINLKYMLKKMYQNGECNTRRPANCRLSAYYATLREMNCKDFTEIYHMISDIPPKPVSDSSSLMTVHLPIISLSVQTNPSISTRAILKDPNLLLDLAPLVIESEKDITFVSCGIRSLKVKLSTDIIKFIKAIIPPSSKPADTKKKKQKKKTKRKRRNAKDRLDDLSEYGSNYSNDIVAEPNVIDEEEDDSEDEDFFKPSDIIPKAKEKPSNSKIYCHAVVKSIGISINELSVLLDNISLALSVQPSQLSNSSITASFSSFNISIDKWVSLKLDGISLTHNAQIGEGFVRVKPINFYLYLDFIINSHKYIDLSFIDELMSSNNEEEENNENNSSIINSNSNGENITENKGLLKLRSSLSTNNNILSPPSSMNKSEIIDFIKQMSNSFLIESLSVVVDISLKSRAELVFPRALGFMFSLTNSTHALCYFKEAVLKAENYFAFPIPSFMFNLKLQSDIIDILLIVADIKASAKSKQLSKIVTLVNEILSKLDKSKKSLAKSDVHSLADQLISPIKKSKEEKVEKAKKKESKLKVLLQFRFLKIEFKVEEISTSLLINRLFGQVGSSSSPLAWGFNVQEIICEIFDSKLFTSASGQSNSVKKKMSIMITPLEVTISHNLFNKIPLFARFADVILQSLRKQKHVNTFLHQLNDHVQHQQNELHSGHDSHILKTNIASEFPKFLSNAILFSIKNTKLQLLLPTSGALVVGIPDISLDVKIKNSQNDSKQAVGFKFQIQNFNFVFDNEESFSSKKKDQISSFHIAKFVISALAYQNDINFESIVDGINIVIYPTIPYAISKILLAIFALSANIAIAKERLKKSDSFNSLFIPSLNSPPKAKVREPLPISPPKRPEIQSPKRRASTININAIRSASLLPEPEKNTVSVITGLFECKNTEIILAPIDNKLQIQAIEVKFMFNLNDLNTKDNNLILSLFIPIKIGVSLSPSLIEYLGSLKSKLPLLSEESQLQKQEEYIALQKEQKKKNKKAQNSSNKTNSEGANKDKITHQRSKNSIPELLEDDDDSILDFSKKLSFGCHITFYSKNVEVCFSCKPRRNDVSCLVGISGISAVASTQSKCISVQIIDFYLHTHNIFALQGNDMKVSRLFQFNIPKIDALIEKSNVIVDVEKIFSSFSSDKVEEIALFNDIWIQPFLKMVSGNESSENIPVTSAKSEDALQKVSQFNVIKAKRSHYLTDLVDGDVDYNDYDDDDDEEGEDMNSISSINNNNQEESNLEIKPKEETKVKKTILNISIKLSIKSIELSFYYAAGHGNISLILKPILVTKTPELIFASVNSISLTSTGQLSCDLNIDNVYFMNHVTSQSLMNDIHLNEIKIKMSMAGDTFLLCSVYQINLLCKIKKEESGDRNTILELSIDSPQLKMTALTIPTIKTFIRTISDPIINGVARATRSDINSDILKKNESEFKTMPANSAPAKIKNNPKPSAFSLNESIKENLVKHLLFAKLSVVIRNVQVVLLRYIFRDKEAIMFSIDAAMLNLDLKPQRKGMNRNLHFRFLPIALHRLTNNEIAPNATNPNGFQKAPSTTASPAPSDQNVKQGKNKKDKKSKANSKDDKEKAKTRPILKIPQVDGTLDTQQKLLNTLDVTYNFYTEFFGDIEPSLNLSDYEMLLALIKYTIANASPNQSRPEDAARIHNAESDSDGFFGSISNNAANNNSFGSQKNNSNNNSNNSNNNNNSLSNNNNNSGNTNSGNKQKEEDNTPKIRYNFTPLNYKFAPSFKVGYGASFNPDITWLLARLKISDEHIIPASLFQFFCIGLEDFLSALTNSMLKASQEDDDNLDESK